MSILDLPHGIHFDVLESVYHQRVLGLVSKHALDKVRRSPAHYMSWVKGAAEKDSEALAFGRAFDCALLEPSRFDTAYVVEPEFGDCRKKENKSNRDAWRAANKEAVWLSHDDYRSCVAMAKSIRSHASAGKLLSQGSSQVTLRWRNEETGLECKARLDHERIDIRTVVDVKTAENAGVPAFAKAAANYGYHRQCALYLDGMASLGVQVDHFVFVVVEKEPPYAVATYVLSEADIERGRSEVRRHMTTLAECIERDAWSAYPEGIQVLTLPAWAA